MIPAAHAPVVEPGLTELLETGVQVGRLTATTFTADAIKTTDLSLVTGGTPSRSKGAPDLASVFSVCAEIGKTVRERHHPRTVVIRSTVPPGTTQRCGAILRKEAGTSHGWWRSIRNSCE